MTGFEAADIRCLTFESQELIEALAQTTIECHQRISSASRCYDPLPSFSPRKREEILGKIESVIYSCFCVVFGQGPSDRFDNDIFVQVSTFCQNLAKDHIFPDGNKRTALVMSIAILHIRGIVVSVEDLNNPGTNEMYRWIQDVVSGKKTCLELAEALKKVSRVGSYELKSDNEPSGRSNEQK